MSLQGWSVHFVLALFCCFASISASRPQKGCAAPFMLPNKPFVVVWNHPSQTCEAHGVKLDFAKWGIVDNDGDSFIGDEISLLYGPGRWPFFSGKAATPINGGLPQLGNLPKHLDAIEEAVKSEVPDAAFSGLGVIDMEKWRPELSLNYDSLRVYQDKSIALARQRFPTYNKTQVYAEAKREFNKAARSFMGETLFKLHTLRPSGKWGYYGYPRCWDSNCNTSTIGINDLMSYIFSNSSGLYPRIYFNLKSDPKQRARFIKQNVGEALRVKAKYGTPAMPVLPYAFCQDTPYEFYNASALQYAIKEPADMGSSGVVLWGGSSAFHEKGECLALQEYLNTTLGPYSMQVTEFFLQCSTKLCTAHGRCVRKDLEAIYQKHLSPDLKTPCRIPKKKLMENTKRDNLDKSKAGDFNDYICKCFEGWHGYRCDQNQI